MPSPTSLSITHVAPSALTPAVYNPRQIDDASFARLKRGITEFGLVDPIIARRMDGLVIGGHQRLRAATELGLAQVPVVYLDEVSDDRAAALNVLLNNPSAQGAWDMGRLSELLTELDAHGFDATLTGFDEDALAGILAWEPEPTRAGEEADDVDLTPPAEPKSQRGEVYELGRHRLVCGDSTDAHAWELLMAGRQADGVWTDPPYGVSYEAKNDALKQWDGRSNRPSHAKKVENDSLTEDALEELLRGSLSLAWAHCKPGAAWYVAGPEGPRQMPFSRVLCELGVWRHTLNWVKDAFVLGRSDYHYRHEPLWYGWKEGAAHTWNGGRAQDSVLEFPRPKKSDLHPTMKPVELVRRCIENSTNAGAIVAEPFGGSGTTLVAAEQTGRTAYVIELDPRYCDVIRRRYAELVNRPDLAP